MTEIDLIQKLLDFGGTGTLVVGLVLLFRGHLVPLVMHEKIVGQLLEIIKEKNAEIARLQQRNEEFAVMLQQGTLVTSKSLEVLRLTRHSDANSAKAE